VTIVYDRPASGHEVARRAMIDSQLRTSGVNAEWVLSRMEAVAREDFVPESARSFAYIDRAIALGGGRHLPAPVFQGMLLQEARPTPEDKVLVVDAGSGYLGELVRPLVGSLEIVNAADAVAGVQGGEFTLLLIDGAVEHLPAALVASLADDARVVTGLAQQKVTYVAVGRKAAGEVALVPVADMGIPLLAEFAKPKSWSF